MSSSNRGYESAVDPLKPLEQLAAWIAGTTIHLVLGLLCGMAVARLMRRWHLHWSWAAAGAGLGMLVRPSLLGWTSTLSVAALSATAWGRRWHREDVEAGGDLAGMAASRRGPLDVLRRYARDAWARRRPVGWVREDELAVGTGKHGGEVSIPLGGRGGGTHTLVVGATGSGKTVTQTWMAVRAIEHGMGAIVVDPKGDRGMRAEVRYAAEGTGRAFIEWTPNGPSVYNPYCRGSETEIADKVLAGERFTEPHYARQAQRYLGHVVRALRRAELEVSLRGIVDHMDPARLEHLARRLPEVEADSTHVYLDSLTSRQQNDLGGVRDRLAILSESDVGPWLDPETSGAQRFDLLQVVRDRAVVYIDLQADSRPLLTQMLGAAIVQDLQTTVAAVQAHRIPTLVVLDEFSAIAAEQVVRLFGRARSAGFSLLLGTQELSDLRLPGRERLLEQVVGNLSVLIAHRQVVPDSAELIAGLAGTRGTWRTSCHSDGRTTRTRTREGVLGANDVVSLGVGDAAVVVLADGPRVQIAHIHAVGRH